MSSKHANLNEAFSPREIETPLYERWEKSGYFRPMGNGQPYAIVIPPPNVTGTLHIGHAFQHTLMDVLIRYQRMCGRQTLWQTGTDHAGIATQMVVMEQLAAEGKSLNDLDREAFVDRVWEWRKESGGRITKQMRRIGSSVDWDSERFTMDEGFSRAVLEVFIRLYEEGLIYRGQRLVNWDPELETALSDLEVVSDEEDGSLWYLRYPLSAGTLTSTGKDHVVVATTRPETMFGDTAVAVNPNDDRFKNLIGKHVVLPLTNRELPIISDEYVNPEFGTGCLKITPAHDFNDNEIAARHNLKSINIFTSKAALNDSVPECYQGLDRFDAREKVVNKLQTLGLLETTAPYKVQIPRGDRSNAIVEPWMTDQWFVKIAPLAERAIDAVRKGDIRFEPKRWENVYFSWMAEIRDWCISRQQWWGHRIPAWYDSQGNIYVGRTVEEARSKSKVDDSTELRQDPDVLETWFSSALWTFATLGWPDSTYRLKTFHPTDVLVTGHDIIFFWVARMIMMTLHFTDEVPFKTVYVHGLVRDAEGQKMSKMRGNGLDPLDLIDGIDLEALVKKRISNLAQPRMARRIENNTRRDFPNGIQSFGTDALRFTFCSLASPGSATYNFDVQRVEGYHHFCNKLWNAARFVLNNVELLNSGEPVLQTLPDRWIRSKLRRLIRESKLALDTYRFDLYASKIYEFIWHEFCDWYLELSKPLLFQATTPDKILRSTQRTLLEVLETTLRIAHPVMPYITETIWLRIRPPTERVEISLMLESFPSEGECIDDQEAEQSIDWLKAVVGGIRNIRGERQVPPRSEVDVLLVDGDEEDRQRHVATKRLVERLAKTSSQEWIDRNQTLPLGSIQMVGNLQIIVPFKNQSEIVMERARLANELTKIQKERERVERKLSNDNFVNRAPTEVVEKERSKFKELSSQVDTLNIQFSSLNSSVP